MAKDCLITEVMDYGTHASVKNVGPDALSEGFSGLKPVGEDPLLQDEDAEKKDSAQ